MKLNVSATSSIQMSNQLGSPLIPTLGAVGLARKLLGVEKLSLNFAPAPGLVTLILAGTPNVPQIDIAYNSEYIGPRFISDTGAYLQFILLGGKFTTRIRHYTNNIAGLFAPSSQVPITIKPAIIPIDSQDVWGSAIISSFPPFTLSQSSDQSVYKNEIATTTLQADEYGWLVTTTFNRLYLNSPVNLFGLMTYHAMALPPITAALSAFIDTKLFSSELTCSFELQIDLPIQTRPDGTLQRVWALLPSTHNPYTFQVITQTLPNLSIAVREVSGFVISNRAFAVPLHTMPAGGWLASRSNGDITGINVTTNAVERLFSVSSIENSILPN